MSWVMVGTVAVSAASSGLGASEGNKAGSQNYLAQLRDNIGVNQSLQEANTVNQIRTGFQVGILNVQRGLRKREAASQKFKISQAALEAMGAAEANQAAAGVVGASADAVSVEIRKRSAEAVIDAQASWETSQFSFDVQLNDIIQAGQDALRAGVRPGEAPREVSVGGAAVKGGMQAAAQLGVQYGMAKYNLGLGTPGTPAATGGFTSDPAKAFISTPATSMFDGTATNSFLTSDVAKQTWKL